MVTDPSWHGRRRISVLPVGLKKQRGVAIVDREFFGNFSSNYAGVVSGSVSDGRRIISSGVFPRYWSGNVFEYDFGRPVFCVCSSNQIGGSLGDLYQLGSRDGAGEGADDIHGLKLFLHVAPIGSEAGNLGPDGFNLFRAAPPPPRPGASPVQLIT